LAFEKIVGIAQKYMLRGQSRKAMKEYEQLIKESPNDIRSHLKLGDVYLKNGDSDKAITEYLKVAELYMQEDLSTRAISVYKRVLSLDPKRVEALQPIAKLYFKLGLRGDAKNYYQSILKMRPEDPDAVEALRTIDDDTKEPYPPAPASAPPVPPFDHAEPHEIVFPGRSEASPQTASAPVDKDAEMHYHLGIAYREMELFDYAISEFELACSNEVMEFDCRMMLGACFMDKGEIEKSIDHYKTAVGLKALTDEKLARLHFSLGCAYEAKGMTSEAIEAFSQVLKLDGSMAEARERVETLQKGLEQ
jgi:tetratricopeptide (TPR) repeat protein